MAVKVDPNEPVTRPTLGEAIEAILEGEIIFVKALWELLEKTQGDNVGKAPP